MSKCAMRPSVGTWASSGLTTPVMDTEPELAWSVPSNAERSRTETGASNASVTSFVPLSASTSSDPIPSSTVRLPPKEPRLPTRDVPPANPAGAVPSPVRIRCASMSRRICAVSGAS